MNPIKVFIFSLTAYCMGVAIVYAGHEPGTPEFWGLYLAAGAMGGVWRFL